MIHRLFLVLSVLLGFACLTQVAPAHAKTLGNKRAPATYGLKVVVKNKDGEAISGATIKVRGPVTGQGPIAALLPAFGKTDGSGHAEFSFGLPGDYWVTCEKDIYETHSYKVTLKDKNSPLTLEVHLKEADKGYPLSVLVHDANGKGIDNAKVVVSRVNGDGPVGGLALPTGFTSDAGRLTLFLAMPTEYRVEVSHDFYGDAVQRVTLSDKTTAPVLDFTLESSRGRFLVTVKSEEGDAIPGATVTVSPGGARSETTDEFGKAYVVLSSTDAAIIKVSVTHPDFESKVGYVEADNTISRNYESPFTLKRKTGRQTVIVDLHEVGTGRPINGATITLDGAKGGKLFTGTSNTDGHAVITVTETDTFTMTITHRGYKTITEQVVVKVSDDTGRYEFPLEMELADKGERDMRRMLEIKVRGKTKAGTSVPLVGATVTLQGYGYGVVTDAYGNAEILHKIAPGEVVSIMVEPKGTKWKKGAGSALIRANGTEFNKIDMSKAEDRHAKDTSAFKETNDIFLKYFQRTFGPQAIDTTSVLCELAGPIGLTGDVIPNKGRAKIGETVNVQVAILYPGDPTLHHSMLLDERVELYGPKGTLITNNIGRRTIVEGEYARRYLNIVCAQEGTYTVKAHVTGAEITPWDDQASFTIVASGGTSPASGGVFKLVKKEVGHAADGTEDQYGAWSGSVGESSFNATYEGKNGYDSHANLSANFSVPPPEIKPGDTIELTCTTSGSVSGKDHGQVSVSAAWGASGNATIIEGTNAFAGIANSGKLYPSGEAKYKVKVGTSGSFTLYSSPSGCMWGSGGVWNPCVYTYEFQAAAKPATTVAPKKTTMTGG